MNKRFSGAGSQKICDQTALSHSPLNTAVKDGEKHSKKSVPARFDPSRGLYSHFADMVQARPEATAVVGVSTRLTYRELDRQAGRVAASLKKAGVRPGGYVALLESRSVSAIVAMLGILRVGAAYVPFDPSHAPEQFPHMATDIRFDAALIAARYQSAHGEIFGKDIPCLRLAEVISAAETSDHIPVDGETPAYVMYTSGTSGAPKGVVVPQRAVAAYVLDQAEIGVQGDDVVLHASTIACDGSVFDIFTALLNGAAVAVVEAACPSLDDIAQVMVEQKVTAILWYAGIHHMMIDHKLHAFETVRLNCAGGDVMSPDHAQRLLAAWPDIKLFNLYGPTEATVDALGIRVTPKIARAGAIPIGKPLTHYEAFVVDEDFAALPKGETGQLVLAGPAVALGYHGLPDRTAQSFIPDPRSGRTGLVYLTGDRAKRLKGKKFAFLGRMDRQVKLAGRRIELDGIEHALGGQPGVAAAIVEVLDSPAGRRIAAVLKPEMNVTEADAAFVARVLRGAAETVAETTLPRLTKVVRELPLTPAGKVDRKAVRAILEQPEPKPQKQRPSGQSVRDTVALIWGEVLACGPVSDETTFFEAGGTSVQLIEAHARLEKVLGRSFDLTLMFETPRLGDLARRLGDTSVSGSEARITRETNADLPENAIAIIGLGGRFPGAGSIADFWQHIRQGTNLIPTFEPDQMQDALSADERANPAYVAARPVLDGVDMFDAKFFDMLPMEAERLDPQARVFLEICFEALEEAGVNPAGATDKIGVFAGATFSTYLLSNLMQDRQTLEAFTSSFQIGDYATLTGNTNDNLAGRVAYKLNLKGPAVAVSTACSTSLTAIAQACDTLRAGRADVALAGGVSITFPQMRGYFAQEGGMASVDGVCRPFDAEAGGTVFGHGAGVVVLKRLRDAVADGDHIYAMIRGAGVNNDGADKMSYTAPSVAGQAGAIRMAHEDAGIEPVSVSYVECHGTATPLGDPIEISGLAQGFGGALPGRCAIGSVKGNIGHLDAAAGVMGVIKTALMLHHREIPPVANYRAPNPRIPFGELPFFVPKSLSAWTCDGPRRAGVSSFGVGGTNVHLLLEEAPERAVAEALSSPQILPLSAKTPEALAEMQERLADILSGPNAPDLADTALTLQDGRRAFGWRLAVAARDTATAAEALRKHRMPEVQTKAAPPVVFLFPGQGAQYPGMGAGLYHSAPRYAEWIDRGAEILKPFLGQDLRDVLIHGDSTDKVASEALRDTRLAQPALYLTEFATAQVWLARGIKPDALIGHSVGEFAAAAMAGVFDFETGLRLIAKRGQLMQDQPQGAMLSVRAGLEVLRPHLGDGVDIAAMNAPKLQVVAGSHADIDALAGRLEAAGIAASKLNTSHAFHSRMMDPVAEGLTSALAQVTFSTPNIPIFSTVTGQPMTDDDAQSPGYWAGQARATVNFQAALQAACKTGSEVFLEVGAGRTLSTLTSQILERGSHGRVFHSLPDHTPSRDDENAMAAAFANLWSAGVDVDWPLAGPRGTTRVSLPTYPFQRKRYWIDPPKQAVPTAFVTEPSLETDHSPMLHVVPQAAPDRTERLTEELLAMLSDLSGEDLGPDDVAASFLELGFDSLFMGQVSQSLQRTYGVTLSFRELLSDYPSIAELTAHLDRVLPADEPVAVAVPEQAAPEGVPAGPTEVAQVAPVLSAPVTAQPSVAISGDMGSVMQAQMQTMQAIFADQLRSFGGGVAHAQPAQAAAPAPQTAPVLPVSPVAVKPAPVAKQAQPGTEEDEPAAETGFRVGRGAALGPADLTPEQQKFADDLARKVSEKFAKSKAYTASHRAALADPRTAAGFRPEWKELAFPIVADRSKGAYIWDLDGNQLVDLVNGFGQTAFGHSPDFVTRAVEAQLHKGFAIGPQSDLSGQVAEKFAKMAGHERVTFCNTGSEAVMAAMRLARAVTGRDRIVVFSNDYHGQFDEVLVKGKSRGGAPAALPIAPGIPRSGLANMTVLEYGAEASLDWIRENINDIAAVIVEPVQSRHPRLRPVEFVRDLRGVTKDGGAALVFDEVVTGFRVHPRGMQGLWDIKADMATYGKVVGGGMPIGVLAGDKRFMDALDGGAWAFGDESKPETAPTFFAGTFVRHPLVLAATDATLDHLAEAGSELWNGVAERAAALAARMNNMLLERGLPELVATYSSWFVINASQHDPRAALLYPLLRLNGVHLIDGYCGFLTTAHSPADLETVAKAFETSLNMLQSVGILPAQDGREPVTPVEAASAEISPEKVFPLTEGQMEIWAAHQMSDMAACSFNESVSLDFEGALDKTALNWALGQIIARHDALRMVFSRSGSGFRVLTPFEVAPEMVDAMTCGNPEDMLADILKEEAATPVEITETAPVRFTLVKMGPSRHVLIMTAHHIACDGWSYGVIFDELSNLYRSRVAGETESLPAAPSFSQHADARSGGAISDSDLAFWQAQFDTVPALPDLPLDRPRPEIRSFRGDSVTGSFDADLVKAIRKAGAAKGCTLFGSLFAALQITLGRLSGSRDVVLAVPTGGQANLENPSLVGHCVNLLPVRVALEADSSFGAHLSRAGAALMKAFDHQDVTFGTLVRELQIKRDLSRLPLTEVQFNLERGSDALDFGPVTATVRNNAKAASNFDLFFNLVQHSGGVRVEVDFNTDILDRKTVKAWIELYGEVIAEIAKDIEARAMPAPIALRSAAPEISNSGTSVVEMIARQVTECSEDIAVEGADAKLSYRDLARLSDNLAGALQTAMPEPGARIAVAVPRGAMLPVALLAVLKAGHAYVPLDPRQPAARLRQIVETAKVTAIVAPKGADTGFADGLGLSVVSLDAAEVSTELKPVALQPETTAYVIFTSGSTGVPKGVEIPHRALANFLQSMAIEPGMTRADCLLSVTTVMFDIAALELFLPLTVGARTIVASNEDIQDGFAIARRLKDSDITMMQATPTLWDMLFDAGFIPRSGLKMLVGGEALPNDLAKRLMTGGGALWNLYGPTETTIWSAVARVSDAARITIGKPVANTDLVVLGEDDNPLPVGITGELNIGGAGLAKGYFGQPDLTATAFRSVRMNGQDMRLYRTGDLARLCSDGEIEVLGRKDNQVKLRGFRIELGDIETRLRNIDGIAKAVVDLRGRTSADKQLVGYVVAETGHQPDTGAVAERLAQELPDYMVPRAWVVLDALPQTANGKLDRKALPEAGVSGGNAAPVETAPMSDLEKTIAGIWGAALNLEQVPVTATLFQLGADSLTIFRIAARQMDQGLDLDARDVLANPSIRQLAAFAENRGTARKPAGPSLKAYRNGARRSVGIAS